MDANFWNDSFKENPDQAHIVDRFLEKEIENLSPGKALDLGCGSGLNAFMLAEHGWSVLGLDWAEIAIHIARQKATEKGLDARFEVADTTLWRPQELFDLVISTYALPGGEETHMVLQTAITALAPGGTLIVAEWDTSMAEEWGFDEADLTTPAEIVAMLPELEIEKAEVVQVMDMFPIGDFRQSSGASANIVLVRACKRSG